MVNGYKKCKKNGKSYEVDEISTKEILDLKSLCKYFGNNFTTNEEKQKVNWKDVKIIKVQKDLPFTILYKYSFEQEEFNKICTKKSTRTKCSNHSNEIILNPAYTRPPKITTMKKKHLLEMCKENAIKEVYWHFYESLEAADNPTNNADASEDEF